MVLDALLVRVFFSLYLVLFLSCPISMCLDVDRTFQVSESFTEINEAEIDEKYL